MSLFLRVANGLAEASARRANKIKAYHGSPHSFDRFSTDAIGTGEGAQAYSRGLYFAEREATALSYRDALTPRDLDYEEDLMRKYNAAESNGDYARMEMLERAMTHDTPSDFRDLASDTDYDEDYRQLASDMADEIESTGTNFGSMYEVEIDVEDADLLNWDVPLDEQPQKVQDALRKTDWYEDAEARVYESAGNRGDNPYGADLLRDLEEDGPEYAAEALREAGIQGVKYADALTRFSKNKTNNYVIFNDEYVDIARKYGIGAASTLGATAALSPQDAEAGVIRNVAGDLFDLGPVMLAGGIALNSMPKGQKDQPSYIDQVYDRGAGILDAGANMVSGAVAPIIQGLQHFDAMGTPNADGSTKSLAQLKAQEIELDEMLNYDLRTERGQQITDRMLQGVADTVIPAVGALDGGLRQVDNFLPGPPYQQAKDSAGALHNWYNKQDEKTRMHLGKLMDILP